MKSGETYPIFQPQNQAGFLSVLQGVERKTLVHGEKTLMTEFRLRKGAVLPRHSHPHEQTGYLVKGHLSLSVGMKEYEVVRLATIYDEE